MTRWEAPSLPPSLPSFCLLICPHKKWDLGQNKSSRHSHRILLLLTKPRAFQNCQTYFRDIMFTQFGITIQILWQSVAYSPHSPVSPDVLQFNFYFKDCCVCRVVIETVRGAGDVGCATITTSCHRRMKAGSDISSTETNTPTTPTTPATTYITTAGRSLSHKKNCFQSFYRKKKVNVKQITKIDWIKYTWNGGFKAISIFTKFSGDNSIFRMNQRNENRYWASCILVKC